MFSLLSPYFLILIAFVFIWLIVLSVFLYRIFHHYLKLTSGVTKKDLRTLLENIIKRLQESHDAARLNQTEIKKIKGENEYNIQKVGLIRYNPFAETGGDQSFCLAMLDGTDTGLVISSLHSRETTRLYAKPIKNGKAAGYELSTEEEKAVNEARKEKYEKK